MRLRSALIGAIWVALVGAPGALAAGARTAAPAPTATTNLAAAQTEAARLLSLVAIPPGAVSSPTEPAGDGGYLGYPTYNEATPNLVDAHAWWTTTESMNAVLAYFAGNVPSGATKSSSGEGVNGGTGAVSFGLQTYLLPAEPGVLSQRVIGVTVAPLPGGLTAIRADGEAVWITPRPPWEQIPAGVAKIEVSGRGASLTTGQVGPPSDPITLTGARAAKVVAFLNAAEIIQPGVEHCPAARPRTVSLRFLNAGGSTVASATENPTGCASISLSIGGRSGPALSDYPSLSNELLRLGAIPLCSGSGLSVSASPPEAGSAEPTVTFTFTNRSSAMCRLPPFPRLALFDGAGRRIRARIHDQDAAAIRREGVEAVTTLDPSQSAEFFLTYHDCSRSPAVRSARVELPGVRPRFTVAIGSRRDPLTPCRGAIAVSSFTNPL